MDFEETRELATDVGRTIAYAAPERLLSERVNVHADFWSLGVMLYEMASGHRPYRALEGPRYRRQLYSAITNNAPAIFLVGTTAVTWTATDGSSNQSHATQTV